MSTQLNSTTLGRWTAALLAIATLFFGLAVIVERSGNAHKAPVITEQTGEAPSAATPSGESQEGNPQPEAAHTENTNEVVLGINLEDPRIVWGFVGLSLLTIVAVLRLGKTALLLAIPLAGAAAVLDAREAMFQFAGSNVPVASLAVLVALAHAAAAILAFMAWRSLRTANATAP